MTTQHTPGPWSSSSYYDRLTDMTEIQLWGGENDILFALIKSVNSDKAKANASLIAAAPELFEALKLCAGNIEGCLEQDDLPSMVILETARKALAKAKGAA